MNEQEIVDLLYAVEEAANPTVYEDYYIPLKVEIAKAIINKIREEETYLKPVKSPLDKVEEKTEIHETFNGRTVFKESDSEITRRFMEIHNPKTFNF